MSAIAVLATGCSTTKQPLVNAGVVSPPSTATEIISPEDVPNLPERETGMHAQRGKRGVLPTVYFSFDSAAISSAERAKLEQAAEYLKSHASARLLLEGHCDWRGTADYNTGLGDRRAQSVLAYLGTLGVPSARLETLSRGDLDAKEGGNDSEMQEDRRVELAVLD